MTETLATMLLLMLLIALWSPKTAARASHRWLNEARKGWDEGNEG